MRIKMKKPDFKIDEIAIVLIVAILAIGVGIYEQNKKIGRIEAVKISGLIVDGHEVSFASGGVINQNKLKQVQNMDYNELKNYLDAEQDFCMYIEDESGNIILAKGSPKLSNDGAACNKPTK